ncbi:MAG: hypothetical protein J6U23_04405 [Clostridiales bacterium]|nr:hypothetical protein [Clostridiales bacterium]
MSSKRLLRLIGNIDDEFILNAAEYHPTKVRKLHSGLVISIVVSVACIALFFAGIIKYTDYARQHAAQPLATHGIKSENVPPNTIDFYFSGLKMNIQINSINDSSIDVTYKMDEKYLDDNLYTYDNHFQLVCNSDGKIIVPFEVPDSSDTKIIMDKTRNKLTLELPDEIAPLEPGDYTLYGYIYSDDLNDYTDISVEFSVPEEDS